MQSIDSVDQRGRAWNWSAQLCSSYLSSCTTTLPCHSWKWMSVEHPNTIECCTNECVKEILCRWAYPSKFSTVMFRWRFRCQFHSTVCPKVGCVGFSKPLYISPSGQHGESTYWSESAAFRVETSKVQAIIGDHLILSPSRHHDIKRKVSHAASLVPRTLEIFSDWCPFPNSRFSSWEHDHK